MKKNINKTNNSNNPKTKEMSQKVASLFKQTLLSVVSYFKQDKKRIAFAVVLLGMMIIAMSRIGFSTSFIKSHVFSVVYGQDDIHTISGLEVILNDNQQTTVTDSNGQFFFFTSGVGKQKITINSKIHNEVDIKIKPTLKKPEPEDYHEVTLQIDNSLKEKSIIVAQRRESSQNMYGDHEIVLLNKNGSELISVAVGTNPKQIDNKTIQYEEDNSLYKIFLDGTGKERIGDIPDEEELEKKDETISFDNKFQIDKNNVINLETNEVEYSVPKKGSESISVYWLSGTHKIIISKADYSGSQMSSVLVKDMSDDQEPKTVATFSRDEFIYFSRHIVVSPDKTRFISSDYLFNVDGSTPISLSSNSKVVFLPNDDFLLTTLKYSKSTLEEGTYIFDKDGLEIMKMHDEHLVPKYFVYSTNPNNQSEILLTDMEKIFLYNTDTRQLNTLTSDKYTYIFSSWLNL